VHLTALHSDMALQSLTDLKLQSTTAHILMYTGATAPTPANAEDISIKSASGSDVAVHAAQNAIVNANTGYAFISTSNSAVTPSAGDIDLDAHANINASAATAITLTSTSGNISLNSGVDVDLSALSNVLINAQGASATATLEASNASGSVILSAGAVSSTNTLTMNQDSAIFAPNVNSTAPSFQVQDINANPLLYANQKTSQVMISAITPQGAGVYLAEYPNTTPQMTIGDVFNISRNSQGWNGQYVAQAVGTNGSNFTVNFIPLSPPSGYNGIAYLGDASTPEQFVGIGTNVAFSPTSILNIAGSVYATAGMASVSDATYKENVVVMDSKNSLELVSQMKPVHYSWKTKEFPERRFSTARDIGFIAQEMHTIVPQAVKGEKDGEFGIDYGKLTSILASAMQELHNKVKELEAKLASYEQQKQ